MEHTLHITINEPISIKARFRFEKHIEKLLTSNKFGYVDGGQGTQEIFVITTDPKSARTLIRHEMRFERYTGTIKDITIKS